MADIELVIKIPEYIYKLCQGHGDVVYKYIAKGTPLKKGHGRLIDENEISLSGIHFETERDHAMMIGRLNSAQTIIGADKAESEDK